ncbi:hypothetical protein Agabi119p4_1444 [Agaricus bisporus var. burnettii]|uniref:Uncharacterized protein n=1 Tax=Agaricus bisporus var. burnettii TaxID=192524 RepID=A0A8H7KKI1_AGABI|nr:hypothetical protein Agabi119p4_1444 [Agaricus bisporus var. burnettii]
MGDSPTPYFISLLVRRIALRIVVISSLASLLINVIIGGRLLVQYGHFEEWPSKVLGLSMIPLSISLHHILRLWPRKMWSVRSDLIYSTIEFGSATGYMIAEIMLSAKNYDFTMAICVFALVFLWLSVGASLVFTVWNLRASQYRTIGCTYDFIENGTSSVGGRYSQLSRWFLLFGENTFKRRFGVDRMFIRGIRGVISIICLLAMITLGYIVLVVQPTQKQLYLQTLWYPYSINDLTGTIMTMQVALALPVEALIRGIDLSTIDLNIKWRPESLHVPCHSSGLQLLQVSCNVNSPFSQHPPDDLIITINYTTALHQPDISMSWFRTAVYLNFNRPGDSLDPMDVIVPPIQLFPGLHLFGTTFYSFRDTYASSRDLSFGIPHYDRRLVQNVQALIPDPEVTRTSNSDNTTATLRLTYQGGSYSVQSGYKIEREQSSNSVLSGFALLGGVWTFINGLFATIFGCSLLLVLFGIKPLSIYGIVHLFQRRRTLVDGGYTLSAEEQSRTIAVLREHLLDDNNDIEANGASEEKTKDGEQSVPQARQDVV